MRVLELDLRGGEGMGAVDAGCGAVGAVDVVVGADAGGGVLVVEGQVGAADGGAGVVGEHVGAVVGAVGVGAVAGEVVGAADVGEDLVGAGSAVVGEPGVDTVLEAAGDEGAVGGLLGAVGGGRVDTGVAVGEQGGGTEAAAGHAGAAAAGGVGRVDDIARLHSCRLSASFCFVSVQKDNQQSCD